MRNQHSGDGFEPVKCRPKSKFSQNYTLDWGGETIDVHFETNTSKGGIRVKKDEYEIVQSGPLSRIWTLEKEGEVVIRAKRKGVRSSIRIEKDNDAYLLERKHLLSPVFLLSDNESVIAEFNKERFFHRDLEIEVMSIEQDFLLLAFAFWLVISVRRASRDAVKR
ncbi:MAG: hypothetical protein OEM82_12285 [Acidobacteriota bacterium]|nr:hypothetical protein [Acidobacteriota bacterium]